MTKKEEIDKIRNQRIGAIKTAITPPFHLPKPTDHDKPWHCPGCKVSLLGKPIKKIDYHLYSGKYFKKEIGIYDREADRIIAYKCPKCKTRWPRS